MKIILIYEKNYVLRKQCLNLRLLDSEKTKISTKYYVHLNLESR